MTAYGSKIFIIFYGCQRCISVFQVGCWSLTVFSTLDPIPWQSFFTIFLPSSPLLPSSAQLGHVCSLDRDSITLSVVPPLPVPAPKNTHLQRWFLLCEAISLVAVVKIMWAVVRWLPNRQWVVTNCQLTAKLAERLAVSYPCFWTLTRKVCLRARRRQLLSLLASVYKRFTKL